ncbi:Schlafen-like protein 1 [Liparis tanakae]|uniref:Schlafen-like protein 1 n=1 Tax=Liparis tanakae TaxID=230148 RepID=A0A4Z2HC71_9TELE|nr:Schlafen-like protein 1 [Liparis tanakae]
MKAEGALILYLLPSCYLIGCLTILLSSLARGSAREQALGQPSHFCRQVGDKSQNLEFSACYLTMDFAKDILRYACAFMNSDGGTLLIGVSDEGLVCGTPVNHKMEDDIRLKMDEKDKPVDIASCQELNFEDYMGHETRHLELKRGQGRYLTINFTDDAVRYGCAFLKTEGGTLLIGVSDDGLVHGNYIEDQEEKRIRWCMDQVARQFNPPLCRDDYTLRFLPITSKGNNKPSESRFPSVRSESTKRKISDFELAQLQDKLRETELVMENIVNHSPDRVEGVTADQEKSLLQQLTEITRVMQEGQLVDRMAPEEKTREDWEGERRRSFKLHSKPPGMFVKEPQEEPWERSGCCCQHGEQHHHHGPERADGDDPEDDGGGGGGARARAPDPREEMESEEAAVETGVPEEQLTVLEEPELTLKMTPTKAEDLGGAAEAGASCGAVRRRNKRRRAKKAAH